MSHPHHGTVPPVRCDCGRLAPPGHPCSGCGAVNPAGPYRGHDPQSPPGAEAALQSFSDQLEDAVEKLKAARDAELDAEETRDEAKWQALLSPECPKVGVFDGVRTTVAVQTAWVAREIAAEESAYKAAKVARQAASAHVDKVKAQISVQQSVARSVGTTYQGAGRDGW